LVAAKNDRAHVDLAEQIREKTAQRIYRAIVCGTIAEDRGEIRAPIGRHPTERKKMAVVPGGKEAKAGPCRAGGRRPPPTHTTATHPHSKITGYTA